MTNWPAPVALGELAATVVVPGSKSGTARSLVLALLADGPGTIAGGLDARDASLMKDACRALGAVVDDADPDLWRVSPPVVPESGGDIDCGLSGTVLRFVPPVAALAEGRTRFHGDRAASDRPVAPLLAGLRQLGAEVVGDELPFSVTGPMGARAAVVDAAASSQLISGLLLSGARLPEGLSLRHEGSSVPSMPYVAMTVAALADRGVLVETIGESEWVVRPGPIAARDDIVEPDLMTAAVFLAAALVAGGRVTVAGWPRETTQPGAHVPAVLGRFGASWELSDEGLTMWADAGLRPAGDLDLHATSELTPIAAALGALAGGETTITGVAHIRGHETDRLAALARELTSLGGDVTERPDGLSIRSAPLHGGVFGCYADHRLAHAGALLGLIVPGIELDDVACTSKTMPRFPAVWQAMLG